MDSNQILHPHVGYFTVGDKKFRSKIQACIYANQTKQQVQWYFNNDEFGKYDWSIEPELSLDELYNQRARSLREKYDYIALLYSAGSDSHNMFLSFVRQGLHVDELIVISTEKGTKGFKNVDFNDKSAVNGSYSEHVLQALPRLQEIRTHYPNIKITVKDMTDHIFDTYKNNDDGSWVENRIEWLNPAGGSRWDFNHILDFKRLLDQGKKTCILVGIEKPRTTFDKDGNYYIIFNDRATTFGPAQHLKDYTNSVVEFFYWSPDSLDLLCKQAYVIKRYVEVRPELWNAWEWPLTWEKIQFVHEPVLRNIVYSTWQEGIYYQATKPEGDWHIQYDQWFFQNDVLELQNTKRIWHEGVKYITENASDFIIYYNGKPDGLKKFYHKYHVGKFDKGILKKE